MNKNFLYGKPPYEIISSSKHKVSFLFLEYGAVIREGNALVFRQNGIDYDLPVATLSAILLGIGTSITQPAMLEISRWGCAVSFVSPGMTGLHSSYLGTSASHSRFLYKQAQIVSSPKIRLEYARKMYAQRWGEDKVPKSYSLQKLMLLEGRRVKALYAEQAKKFDIQFTRKQQVDFSSDDVVNQNLTMMNHLLYGVINAVVVSIGLSPGLGVIHHGNASAFIFDVADLYKEEYIIPLSFQFAAEGASQEEVRSTFRYLMRKTV